MRKKAAVYPTPRPEDLLGAAIETIELPRAWVKAHPPHSYSYRDLVAQGFVPTTQTRGDIVQKSYRHGLDVAYVREGPEGQALWYVQCWIGPA